MQSMKMWETQSLSFITTGAMAEYLLMIGECEKLFSSIERSKGVYRGVNTCCVTVLSDV